MSNLGEDTAFIVGARAMFLLQSDHHDKQIERTLAGSKKYEMPVQKKMEHLKLDD